jgi:vitamin B12 transporter
VCVNRHEKENPVTNWKYTSLIIALASVPAFADEGGEIVVTATGIETPRSDVGQAITVIDRDLLENRQNAFISDILADVPSVAVVRSGGPGAQSSVFIRGANSSQTLVLIDGVRINDPSSPNGAFDFGALVTGNVDQVEVLRGPNSVVWGSQAIGGVVNVRNAIPQDGLGIRAAAEYGAHDSIRGNVNIAGTSGPVAFSFGAGHQRTDGISTIKAGTERDGFEGTALNGRAEITLNEALSVDLRGYYNHSVTEIDDIYSSPPDVVADSRNNQLVGYAGLKLSLLDDRFKSRIAYSRTDIERDGRDPTQAGTITSFNVYNINGTIDRYEYQGSFEIAKAAQLIFGAEHEKTKASVFYPAGGGTRPDRADSKVTSFYGQAIVRPVKGLTLTGGVRHDDYDLYGSETTFGANAAYSPNGGKTVLRSTYAEGFRAPTLTESVMPFGNVALTPETVKSYDLGIEQHLMDRKLRLSATYFHRTSRDQIVFSFMTFQSENIQRVKAEGVELELNARPTETLELAANYSFVDSRDKSPGMTFDNLVARRPRNQLNVSVDWTSPIKLKLGASLRIVGDSYDDNANAKPLDGYALASIRASYPLTQNLELYGRIENLFDTDYEVAKDYSVLGRAAYAGFRLKL